MDTETRWWFGADREWHQGEPPSGWWQATDRRWYPPEDVPDERLITTGPRHMAPGDDPQGPAADDGSFDGQRPWADIGIPVALAVLMVAVVVMGILWVRSFSAIGGDGSFEAEPAQDGLVNTPTTVAGPGGAEIEPSPTTDRVAAGADETTDSNDSTADTASQPPSTVSQPSTSGDDDPSSTTAPNADGTPSSSRGDDSDDCLRWTPPGRPDHPVAPGRADRDGCG
jgi:hypothetical protein